MATFEYEAVDLQGKNLRGIVNADSPRHARQTLRGQNLTPIKIANPSRGQGRAGDKKFRAGGLSIGLNREPSISSKELVLITRQLATLVDTGVPLEEALNALAQQSDSERVRGLILSVRERVLEGWRFSDAMGEHPKSFSPLYRAVVAAGETSGDLGSVLERLATMLEKNRAIRSKAITALIYPIVLAVVSIGVVIALMRFVVPKIVDQFADFDAQLPFITRMVIAISEGIGNYGLWILLALLVFGVLCWQLLKQPAIRERVDKSLLSFPLLGKLIRGLDGARFGRTLATLFAGGAPLIDALTGAQRTLTNSYIKKRLDIAITSVREGAGLSAGLKRAGTLPPMMVHMVAAGEKSGELPKLLDKTAEHLEEEFETVTTVGLRLLEPVIVVAMGIIVMIIVLSIMLPTLQLNTLASGG